MAMTDAERKRKERERKKAHLKEVGAERIGLTLFRGTRECLDRIKDAGGFEEDGEAITVLLHNLDDFLKRDMSRYEEMLKVDNLRG